MTGFFQDRWRASRQLRQAAPWIGITLALAICAVIVFYDASKERTGTDPLAGSGDWWLFMAAQTARLVLVGFAAAFFTRFFGSIGMYKDAISDLFREDTWLDRRNDLEDLWRDVTRRVFMPGSDASGYKDMLHKVNEAMSQMLGDEKTRKPYFLRQARYDFYIGWKDKTKGIVDIEFNRQFDLYPFNP